LTITHPVLDFRCSSLAWDPGPDPTKAETGKTAARAAPVSPESAGGNSRLLHAS